MSKEFRVTDEFRTNPLSLKPGGSTVTVHYDKADSRIYDKIKNTRNYIYALSKLNDADSITQIDIDGEMFWKRTETERNFF